jgi:hypothetical protein
MVTVGKTDINQSLVSSGAGRVNSMKTIWVVLSLSALAVSLAFSMGVLGTM